MKTTPFHSNILLMAMCLFCLLEANAQVPNGYDLWLGYHKIEGPQLAAYQRTTASIYFPAPSEVLATAREELKNGLERLLDRQPLFTDAFGESGVEFDFARCVRAVSEFFLEVPEVEPVADAIRAKAGHQKTGKAFGRLRQNQKGVAHWR